MVDVEIAEATSTTLAGSERILSRVS